MLPLLDNFPKIFFENPTGKLATVYAEKWQYNNQFCLVGDAAHLINPVTGGGIAPAVKSGMISGQIAAEAIKNKPKEQSLFLMARAMFRILLKMLMCVEMKHI